MSINIKDQLVIGEYANGGVPVAESRVSAPDHEQEDASLQGMESDLESGGSDSDQSYEDAPKATRVSEPSVGRGGDRRVRLTKLHKQLIFECIRDNTDIAAHPTRIFDRFMQRCELDNVPISKLMTVSKFRQSWNRLRKNVLKIAQIYADSRNDGSDWSDGSDDEYDTAMSIIDDLRQWKRHYLDPKLAWRVAFIVYKDIHQKKMQAEKKKANEGMYTSTDKYLEGPIGKMTKTDRAKLRETLAQDADRRANMKAHEVDKWRATFSAAELERKRIVAERAEATKRLAEAKRRAHQVDNDSENEQSDGSENLSALANLARRVEANATLKAHRTPQNKVIDSSLSSSSSEDWRKELRLKSASSAGKTTKPSVEG